MSTESIYRWTYTEIVRSGKIMAHVVILGVLSLPWMKSEFHVIALFIFAHSNLQSDVPEKWRAKSLSQVDPSSIDKVWIFFSSHTKS